MSIVKGNESVKQNNVEMFIGLYPQNFLINRAFCGILSVRGSDINDS